MAKQAQATVMHIREALNFQYFLWFHRSNTPGKFRQNKSGVYSVWKYVE
jgi:hypothetical protein